MSEKRRDSKGRILHNGEVQQKDGRYRFKYYDSTGKDRYLYSWRLDRNDKTPAGKAYRSITKRTGEKTSGRYV